MESVETELGYSPKMLDFPEIPELLGQFNEDIAATAWSGSETPPVLYESDWSEQSSFNSDSGTENEEDENWKCSTAIRHFNCELSKGRCLSNVFTYYT